MPLSPASFDAYLQDASGYKGEASDVFLPADAEEARAIVRQAASGRIPVTVAGAGTGLTGARVPHGGFVLSLERLRSLTVGNGRAHCGAGVLLNDLHQAAAATHQFFGPNPTEGAASIGGIVSTNAGGARSFRYRSVRHHVLAVEMITADGELKRFEKGEQVNFAFQPVHLPATTKNSAGYYLQPELDWVDLLAGSEGTLGVITAVDLQLLPEPSAILSGVVFFTGEELALDAVEAWRSTKELRLLEFLDAPALEILRPRYAEIPANAVSALLIEQNLISEEDQELDLWADRLGSEHALEEASWFGFRQADHTRFRELRHALPTIVTDRVRRNGFPKFSTDFAVPLSRHRELHAFYRKRCDEVLPGKYTIFGHVGDANNHINLLPETPSEARAGEELMHEFAKLVITLGGTVAAEHGIGKTKTDLLAMMYSPAEIDSMRAVKRHLDPAWLLGQGNLFSM